MEELLVASISDLHFDYLAEDLDMELTDLVSKVIGLLNSVKYEYLLIGGDISNYADLSIRIIERIQKETNRPTYFIAGNHDLFKSEDKEKYPNSKSRYELLCNHPQSLINRKIVLPNGYHLIGHIGWYDYSYINEELYSDEQLQTATLNGRTWGDKKYIDFDLNDKEISKIFNDEIETLITNAPSDKTILITHMINHPKFSRESINAGEMTFFNAYLGSVEMFNIIKEYKVKYAICGHVHYRFNFPENGTQYISNSLGYSNYWNNMSVDVPLSLEEQILDSLYFIKTF